jgi:hypothetical protein
MAAPSLRPLSLGEVLDVAFALYRSQFAPLLVVAAACQVLPMAMAVYINTTGSMAAQLGMSVLYLAVAVVLSALGVAASTLVISEAYLGRTLPASVALSRAAGLLGRLIGVSFLSWLLIGFGLMLLIVPGLILLAGLVLSAVVAVLEGAPTATEAMGRSWELTRGFRGKVFLAMLVAFLMLIVPGIAVGGAAAVVGLTDGAASLGILVLESVLQLFIYPYVYVVMTVLYYDLRVRKEGFDLELLASALESA